MPCEICGREGGLVRAKIEGSILRVCKNCARFGELFPETKSLAVPIMKRVRGPDHRAKPIESESVLVSDYGRIVRAARERRGLSQKDFAKKLNEKESIIRQIEHEHIKPDDATSKKIQNFLGVKLLTIVADVEDESTKSAELSLSDIAKIRKR